MELIRPVALFLLLFCGVAVGAEAERRQAEPCANGNTHQAGFCPAVLSSASCSATGATTGSCSATSDETDGTRYVCATSNNTALTGAEIEACSGGAAIAGSSSAETGSNSVSLSGLTTDAAHYGQIVNKSPEQWYSNRLVSSSFTPANTAGTNQARVDAALGSFTAPFVFSYPADPITTSSATVTPATFSANNVNGREITLSAGSYGNISLSGSDKDLILQSGVIIGSLSITSGSRIRVRAASGAVRDNTISEFSLNEIGAGPTDVLIDGITMEGGNARVYMGANRAAVINSKLDVGTGTFAASSFYGGVDDIIMANNEMITPGSSDASVRFQGPATLVFVGNRVTQSSPAYNTFRIHANDGDVENAYVAGNQFEGTRLALIDSCCGGADEGYRLVNIWFEDNDFYMTNGNAVFVNTHFNITGWDRITYLSLQRNNGYGPTSTWISGSPWTGYGYDIADNTSQAYTTPPAWSHL